MPHNKAVCHTVFIFILLTMFSTITMQKSKKGLNSHDYVRKICPKSQQQVQLRTNKNYVTLIFHANATYKDFKILLGTILNFLTVTKFVTIQITNLCFMGIVE